MYLCITNILKLQIMKIENIDTAKELKDEITKLNRLLESDNISNITVTFYDKTGYRRDLMFTGEVAFETVKQKVRDKKDRLENKLNELL